MKNILGNWKTTLAGVAAGALNMYAHGTDPKNIALSVVLSLLGILANDVQNANK